MARLIVEKEKVASNVLKIKETVAPARVIGVVKGNGYGLGLAGFAALLRQNGVDMFAVARLEEGLALRESGIQEDILLMTPAPMPAEAEAVIENGLIATVSCHDDAVVLNGLAEAHGKKARAHVKIDSGFGRYGFLPAEADKILPIFDFCSRWASRELHPFSNAFARTTKPSGKVRGLQFALDTLAAAGADCGMRHGGLLRRPSFRLYPPRRGEDRSACWAGCPLKMYGTSKRWASWRGGSWRQTAAARTQRRIRQRFIRQTGNEGGRNRRGVLPGLRRGEIEGHLPLPGRPAVYVERWEKPVSAAKNTAS
jgi:hypothetical protein